MEIAKITDLVEDTPRDNPANFGGLVELPQIGVLEKTIVRVENRKLEAASLNGA